MGALEDYEDAFTQGGMPMGGALSADFSTAQSVSPEDPQARKDIFNKAAQRLLQARQAMTQPYAGHDLGNEAFSTGLMGSAPSMGELVGNAIKSRTAAEEAQRQAMQQYQQQQSGLDTQAQLAQILGDGGSLTDTSAIAAISGQDKISDNLAKLDLYGSGKGNATLTAARQLMKNDPSLDFATAFSIAKSGVGLGNTVKDGKIGDIAGSVETDAKRKTAQKTAEDTAAEEVKKKSMFPKATASLSSAEADADNLDQQIAKALPQVNYWTAGMGGVSLEKLAGTPARNLAERLRTIKANATTAALQEMRDNSPTGGALGQVSDYEDKMLASKVANLENAQDPIQLKDNLLDLQEYLKERRIRIRKAYKMDYGRFLQNDTAPEAAGTANTLTKPTPEQARAILEARRKSKK